MGRDVQVTFLLAAAVHHEVGLLGLSAETAGEIAVDVGFARSALDVEQHVVGQRRNNFQALVGALQRFAGAHLIGDVDDRHVEPALAVGVFHQAAAVVEPANLAVGAAHPVGDAVGIAHGNLLADGVVHPLPIFGKHQALEGIARQRAELVE